MHTLEIIPTVVNIDTLDSAMPLAQAFAEETAVLAKWESKLESLRVTDESQTAEMKMAREARLELRRARISLDKKRKELKESAQRRVQKIDGTARPLNDAFERAEAQLLEWEDFGVRAAEARIRALEESRRVAIQPYLSAIAALPAALASLTEDQFVRIIADAKDLIDLRAAKAKAEEEARKLREEQERAERERVRVENERLKQEAAERDRAAAVERRRLAEAARKEREERERLEREIAAKAKAEADRKAEEEAARAKAEQAPDKDKLIAFAAALNSLPFPAMQSSAGKKASAEIAAKLRTVLEFITSKATTL